MSRVPLRQDEMASADGVIDILRHRRDDWPRAAGVHPGQQDRRNDRASLQLIGRQRRRQGVAIIGGADVRSVRTSAGRRWTRPGTRGRIGPGRLPLEEQVRSRRLVARTGSDRAGRPRWRITGSIPGRRRRRRWDTRLSRLGLGPIARLGEAGRRSRAGR